MCNIQLLRLKENISICRTSDVMTSTVRSQRSLSVFLVYWPGQLHSHVNESGSRSSTLTDESVNNRKQLLMQQQQTSDCDLKIWQIKGVHTLCIAQSLFLRQHHPTTLSPAFKGPH